MNASQTIDLNQNTADCIHAVLGVGATTYQNICTGAASTVPWGVGDWIITSFAALPAFATGSTVKIKER